ncbi:MAG: hypothetical protein JWM90_803 [Thermoleophilia bacterium]|nr:hypothetical protein [Thermoleophilia bacterium]
MSVGYASFAAPPIASSARALGITSQPALTTPVVAPQANVQAPASPNAQVQTGFTAAPVAAAQPDVAANFQQAAATSVVGGGLVDYIKGNATSNLAAVAQRGIKGIQDKMNAEMASAGGTIDPLKVQMYTQQMSSFEMIMQMVAKMQETEENCTRAFLR